jgi:hypothetical protein
MGESDEAPSVYSSLIYTTGFFVDDLYWALLLPMDGTLKFFYDKSTYIAKQPPVKVYDLKQIMEVKKGRVQERPNGNKYYFHIRREDAS